MKRREPCKCSGVDPMHTIEETETAGHGSSALLAGRSSTGIGEDGMSEVYICPECGARSDEFRTNRFSGMESVIRDHGDGFECKKCGHYKPRSQ